VASLPVVLLLVNMMRQWSKLIPIVVLIAAVLAPVFTPATAASAGDFTQWVPVDSGTRDDLLGIWVRSATDVFVVGNAGTILHYDGRVWVPMTGGTSRDLHSIWGSSAADVFAVGGAGTILHYDGKAWVSMPSGTDNDLYAIWGSSGNDVFAVGRAGTILRYNGKDWAPMTGAIVDNLYGIWGTSAANVFAVGSSGTILHYDGKAWVQMPNYIKRDLFGIWGSSGVDIFAVGREGVILRYDGKEWVQMFNRTPDDLYGVWGSSGTSVFAVGRAGAILHYDAESWEPMTSRTRGNLYGVSGVSSLNVFAVGVYGTILRFTPPVVTEVSPSSCSQGETLDVTVTGRNLTGASEVSFGAGIAVNSFKVSVSGQINANITVTAGAAPGGRGVSVTTPGGISTLLNGFVVKQALPIVATISPNQANQEASLNVVITGANFTGASEVNFGPGIITNNFAVLSANQIMANITVTTAAAMGARSVFVTTPGGTSSLPDGFIVKQALPVITSLSPNQGSQGATLDITITGNNFNGAGEVRFGPGVAVNRFRVASANEIVANVTVIAGATPGTREVSVTTPGGTSTLPDGFMIKQGLPVIVTVSPAWGDPGDTLDVIINGSNLDGATSVSFGSEVAVNSFSNRSPTQIAARVTISRNASAGVRDVSVTTGGGTGILAGGFTVKEGPLGTLFIALIWAGVAVAVVVLVLVLRALRSRKVASL